MGGQGYIGVLAPACPAKCSVRVTSVSRTIQVFSQGYCASLNKVAGGKECSGPVMQLMYSRLVAPSRNVIVAYLRSTSAQVPRSGHGVAVANDLLGRVHANEALRRSGRS